MGQLMQGNEILRFRKSYSFHRNFVFLLLTLNIIYSSSVFADTMSGGWEWPTGSSNFCGYLVWLGYNPGWGYHLAQDMCNSAGAPVYSIGDGEVISSGLHSSYGCNGNCSGGCVLARYKAADGTYFTAMYGHLDNWVGAGSISAGQIVGYTRGDWNPPHLHFSIHPGYDASSTPFRGYTSDTGNIYGFTAPIPFLNDHPASGSGGGKPDLVVREVNLSKTTLTPGESFHIDTRIKNEGDADADHSFKIKYLLSPGTTTDNSTTLDTDSISSLGKGDSTWENTDVTAPQTPGTYNITVKADSSTDIDESHESNNYFNPPVVITVHISPAVLSIITNLIMAEDEKSEISVTPASLDFGDINVGATSTAQTITVENVGNADLKIGTLSTSSTEFVLQHDLCSGKTLAASANCTVDVIFKPASAEPKDEALSVPSNDTKTPVAEAGLLGYAVMPTPPLAPSNLTAKAISSTQIVLAWRDNADNEAGFKIERKTGSCASTTAWSHVATKTANSITFTNSGLIAGTAYSYRIKASNAGGASTSSNCATATTGKAGTPNAPAGLKATSVSAKKITLTWADKSTDETSFKVYRKDSGAWGLLTTLPANATAAVSYSDAAATGNTATTGYSYRVQACNESGCSPATAVAFAPFKPTTLSATASSGKIDLSWIDNSSNETGFQVYKKPGACTDTGTWSILTTTLANAESDSETAVTTGSTYSYKVRAFYKSTASPYSYGYSMFAPCFSLQAQ